MTLSWMIGHGTAVLVWAVAFYLAVIDRRDTAEHLARVDLEMKTVRLWGLTVPGVRRAWVRVARAMNRAAPTVEEWNLACARMSAGLDPLDDADLDDPLEREGV